MKGHELITEERKRQIEVEGFDHWHDAELEDGSLADAACGYLIYTLVKTGAVDAEWSDDHPPARWPFHRDWWKPSDDPVRNLVKAGALIAAEIDRIEFFREYERDFGPQEKARD